MQDYCRRARCFSPTCTVGCTASLFHQFLSSARRVVMLHHAVRRPPARVSTPSSWSLIRSASSAAAKRSSQPTTAASSPPWASPIPRRPRYEELARLEPAAHRLAVSSSLTCIPQPWGGFELMRSRSGSSARSRTVHLRASSSRRRRRSLSSRLRTSTSNCDVSLRNRATPIKQEEALGTHIRIRPPRARTNPSRLRPPPSSARPTRTPPARVRSSAPPPNGANVPHSRPGDGNPTRWI